MRCMIFRPTLAPAKEFAGKFLSTAVQTKGEVAIIAYGEFLPITCHLQLMQTVEYISKQTFSGDKGRTRAPLASIHRNDFKLLQKTNAICSTVTRTHWSTWFRFIAYLLRPRSCDFRPQGSHRSLAPVARSLPYSWRWKLSFHRRLTCKTNFDGHWKFKYVGRTEYRLGLQCSASMNEWQKRTAILKSNLVKVPGFLWGLVLLGRKTRKIWPRWFMILLFSQSMETSRTNLSRMESEVPPRNGTKWVPGLKVAGSDKQHGHLC